MSFNSGSAVSYYILDISDAERKAAQLRSLYQGIRQDAASLATPVIAPISTGNTQAQVAVLGQQATATASVATQTQLLIASTVELGVTAGLTTEQINAELAALSRDALAAGDVVAANELIDASLGIMAEQLTVVAVAHEKATLSVEAQANAELQLARTQAQTLKTSGDSVGALQLLTTARNNATNASQQAIATTNTQIASLEKSATATGAFEGALNTLANPMVLFTAAAATAASVVNSFSEALKFKGDLDETTNSIRVLLAQTRDTGTVFADAQKFADKYKLTQEETTTAISESIPIFRKSTESTEEILSALERLALTKPGKTFQDASRALSELQSGNAVSINRIFDIPLVKANEMKKEIEGGADAVTVLNSYLIDTGVTTSALEVRTQGLKGAYRDAAIEAERLKLAQAKFGEGPGKAVINLETGTITNTTTVVEHLGSLMRGDFKDSANAADQGIQGFADSLKNSNPLANALGQFIEVLSGSQKHVAQASDQATIGVLRSADADDRLGRSANVASVYVDKLTHAQYQQNQQALDDQRVGERSGGLFDTVDQLNTFSDRQQQAAQDKRDQDAKAAQDAHDLTEAEISYAQSTNDIATARKLLNQELVAAKGNTTEEFNIKSRIAQLDKDGVKPSKGLSGLDRTDIKLAGDYQDQLAEVNRRLASGHLTQQQRNQLLLDQIDLQNKINDAIQKEKDLQIGIGLDQVHNQQKLIEEETELSGLRRAEKDSRFSAVQQQAIRLREQEILLDQQKRANDLTKEQADLVKTVNQSGVGAAPASTGSPQGVLPASQVPPIGSGLPVASQGAIPVTFSQGGAITVNLTVNVDKNGIPTAVQTDPSVALNLISKSLGIQVASGGFP